MAKQNDTTSNHSFSSDFNLDSDYIADPLFNNGIYRANVTSVKLDLEAHAIIWELVCDGNEDAVKSDGETPIDGSKLYFRNYLPKSEDAELMTSSGSMTKRQSKINQLKKFADKMQISMNNMAEIAEHCDNADWIGITVLATTKNEEYNGNISTKVNDMRRAAE